MFANAIHNVIGDVPFSAKKFPIKIITGDYFESVQFCARPDDVPRGVDFIILETNVVMSNNTWDEMTDAEKGALPVDAASDPTNPHQIPWGDWTAVAKGAVLLAKQEGRTIESNASGEWMKCDPQWLPNVVYRAEAQPVVETVTLYGHEYEGLWHFEQGEADGDTHCFTFTTEDGKPATGTFRNDDGDTIILDEV